MKYSAMIANFLESTKSLKFPDRSNVAKILWQTYLWQEICSRATKTERACWKSLQEQKLLPDDDELRKLRGEHILLDTNTLACVIKVEDPRDMFDRDLFIKKVARKYKIKETELVTIAEKCVKPSKAKLTKRIAERTPE